LRIKKIPNKPYLDYYSKHNISPVINEVDWNLHMVQRKSLYNRLGIIDCCIKGKNVLEFGPGNGANALYTLSMLPQQYVLVDANPKGIKNCKENLSKFYPKGNWMLVDSLIEEYESGNKFDVVICECLLPQQTNPSEIARHCSSFLDSGGIFVATCHDMVSTVSETLRSLPGWLLAKNNVTFDDKVKSLSNFYHGHLSHLKGMTRSYDDWVIDNVLHKEFWQDSKLFSIEQAIDALKDDFIVYATCPTFLQDWSWYKSVKNVKNHFNESMKESYWENVHNLIDWRISCAPKFVSENRDLYELCSQIRYSVRDAAEEDSAIGILIERCQKLSDTLPEEYSLTKTALESYIGGLKFYKENGKINFKLLEEFGAWWGRGLQYVSFIKN